MISERSIMEMEIHPELIRLRKERLERYKRMYEGMANAVGFYNQGQGPTGNIIGFCDSLFGPNFGGTPNAN